MQYKLKKEGNLLLNVKLWSIFNRIIDDKNIIN